MILCMHGTHRILCTLNVTQITRQNKEINHTILQLVHCFLIIKDPYLLSPASSRGTIVVIYQIITICNFSLIVVVRWVMKIPRYNDGRINSTSFYQSVLFLFNDLWKVEGRIQEFFFGVFFIYVNLSWAARKRVYRAQIIH